MSAILLDVETTGLDPAKDRIIEIAAIRVEEDWKVSDSFSTLVWGRNYPELTKEITEITRIDMAMLEDAVSPVFALEGLKNLITPDVTEVVAYNATFDEGMVGAEIKRWNLDLDPSLHYLMSKDWLCAMEDVEVNLQRKCKKLSHLALDHGLPVDPRTLHRAMDDVKLMRNMLDHVGAKLSDMRAYKDMPYVYLKAVVQKPWDDGGVSTGQAKALGYRFERAANDYSGKEFKTTWVKRVKEKQLSAEIQQAPFKVAVIS